MGFTSVLIVGGSDAYWWEATLIRGVLSHFGIPSAVVNHEQADEYGADALRVILRPRPAEAAPAPPEPPGYGAILAGRHFTFEYLRGQARPPERAVLVYGEPYALIPRLARSASRFEGLRGQALLGPLLDPREYRTPAPLAAASGTICLLTSIGCQKRCGYCAYGATFTRLYRDAFVRRSRPWQDLLRELVAFGKSGSERFVLLADQFLACAPEDNRELRLLASYWSANSLNHPSLSFTVAPLEVLGNRPLLELLSSGFDLHPTLSIDSLDDETLKAFGLSFTVPDALEAASALAALGVAFRLNYIFIRPGLTVKSLARELPNLTRLANIASSLRPEQQLLLISDIFGGRFVPLFGSPLWDQGPPVRDYERQLRGEVLRLIMAIQGIVAEEIEQTVQGKDREPLRTVVEAVALAVARAA